MLTKSVTVEKMKGVYDALDHQFLKMLIIAVVKDPEDASSVIESYQFGFTYYDGIVQTNLKMGGDDSQSGFTGIPTKQDTVKSAKQLLRQLLVLTSSLEDLPSGVFMTVRLLYYDNVTPSDYQPPGFIEANEKDSLSFLIDAIRVKMGGIITPYAVVKLRARVKADQFASTEDEEGNHQNLPCELNNSQVECNLSQATTTYDQFPENIVPAKGNAKETPGASVKAVNKSTDLSSEADIEGRGVRCPCGDDEDDGVMILCALCKYWQHAICFCIPDSSRIPERHTCQICAESKQVMCTDPRLPGLERPQRQEMCLWRRTLRACFDLTKVSVAELSKILNCTRPQAQRSISRLIDERIVNVSKGPRQQKTIDRNKLKEIFEREVKHVSKNLARQRGEVVTSQDTPGQETKRGGRSLRRNVNNQSELEMNAKVAKLSLHKSKEQGTVKRKRSLYDATNCDQLPYSISQVSTDDFQVKVPPPKKSRASKAKMT